MSAPATGSGRKQITRQGQTAQKNFAANPEAKQKGASEPRDLDITVTTEGR